MISFWKFRPGRCLASVVLTSAFLSSGISGVSASDADIDPAAAALSLRYSLSISEAQARISNQAAQASFAEETTTRYAEDFAGAWIDQMGGGQLHLSFTESGPKSVSNDPGYTPELRVSVSNVARFSFASLVAAQDVIASSPRLRPATKTYVDPRQNKLVVQALPDLPFEIQAELKEIVSRYPVSSVKLSFDLDGNDVANTSAQCASNSSQAGLYGCTQPLRGGIGIRSVQTEEICTIGVPVKSNSDSLPYVVTAAHCFDGVPYGSPVRALNNLGQWGSFGVFHSGGVSGSGTDWALVSINPGLTYSGVTLVEPSVQPGKNTTYDENYSLSAVGGSVVGAFYCKQGTVGDTACGDVVGTRIQAQGASGLGQIWLSGETAHLCQGDSGSAVFANHLNYGVQVKGVVGTENGTHVMPPGYPSSTCYEQFYYLGASAALNALHVHLL